MEVQTKRLTNIAVNNIAVERKRRNQSNMLTQNQVRIVH